MLKSMRPATVIILALAVAAGAAIYFNRRFAQPQAGPTGPAVSIKGGGHFRGPANAKVTLVEFGDYQCPSCGAYHPVVKELLSRFPDQVRLEFHHYPLVSIHPNAMAAATAVEAAGEQGKYWEMHDLVMENQAKWSASPNPETEFVVLANRIGVNSNAFMQAMRSPEIQERILQDVVRAREAKVEAVPTFFIDGRMLRVRLSIDEFVGVIESELQKSDSARKPS